MSTPVAVPIEEQSDTISSIAEHIAALAELVRKQRDTRPRDSIDAAQLRVLADGCDKAVSVLRSAVIRAARVA